MRHLCAGFHPGAVRSGPLAGGNSRWPYRELDRVPKRIVRRTSGRKEGWRRWTETFDTHNNFSDAWRANPHILEHVPIREVASVRVSGARQCPRRGKNRIRGDCESSLPGESRGSDTLARFRSAYEWTRMRSVRAR